MRRRSPRDERPLSAVPPLAKWTLLGALLVHVTWQALAPTPTASASALRPPPGMPWLRLASLGDPIVLSQVLTLYLQAFDNQPGISIPFARLDYNVVIAWLSAMLELDPAAQYPLMMASQIYSLIPDERKQRQMLEFVHRQFLRDPDRRWRWLAHCSIVAKHRLKDMPLALRYAEDIARYARGAQGWARQMRIFLLEDLGEREAAAVLLGGLLESGEIKDPNEIRFLMQRLEALKAGEKSTMPSKFR